MFLPRRLLFLPQDLGYLPSYIEHRVSVCYHKRMKLYLSSAGVPNTKELLKLFPQGAELTVAIVPNARDFYPAVIRTQEVDVLQKTLAGIGFVPTLIDLVNMKGSQLQDELSKYSLIWFMGGNTFYLNYIVRESGLLGFIRPLLENGLVYGGESAGAVLASATLHGVELMDDPKEAPEVIWDGLGLVDIGIVPHWGMEKYAQILEKCKVEMQKYVEVKTLTNDQALISVDGIVRLVEKEQK